MSTFPWDTPAAEASICTTGLNSLADGSSPTLANCTEIANGTGLYTHGVVEISLASLNIAAATGFVSLYLVPDFGNGYPEMTATTNVPPASLWISNVNFVLKNGTQLQASKPFLLPPLDFKIVPQNRLGVALAASGSMLKIRTWKLANAA